jgi:DNA (cytosine-5)-methyltransferase 1
MIPNSPAECTVVDLYCGSGAVTDGLTSAGLRVVAAVDIDPVACETYRLNHPSVHLYESDVAKVDPAQIRRVHLKERNLGLLVICAPCQPFSSQNRAKKQDSRMQLVLEAIRFAAVLRPKLIFFENVPGIASARHAALLTDLRSGLAHLGYQLSDPIKIDAADFEVPQRRKRCVMVAARKVVSPSEFLRLARRPALITVKAAIGQLRRLKSGESDPTDRLHRARCHQAIALKRLKVIPKDGGSRAALPVELELACHVGHGGHPDVYGRMSWDAVAPTLTTGCTDITRGRFAHPEDDRAITLREAARLQTFRDDYQFAGNASQIATQIGNAVPVQMICNLAPSLVTLITGKVKRRAEEVRPYATRSRPKSHSEGNR